LQRKNFNRRTFDFSSRSGLRGRRFLSSAQRAVLLRSFPTQATSITNSDLSEALESHPELKALLAQLRKELGVTKEKAYGILKSSFRAHQRLRIKKKDEKK
jgi:hypothetical protein